MTKSIFHILNRKSKGKVFAMGDEEQKPIVNRMLNGLQCPPKWETDNGEQVATYTYQGGHFRLRLEKNTPYARLMYLFFLNAPVRELELIRQLCNQCNINSGNERLFYSVNGEKNEVDVHLMANVAVMNDQEATEKLFVMAMNEMFSWQNVMVRQYERMRHAMEYAPHHDLEKDNAEWERELVIMHEAELMIQRKTMAQLPTDDAMTLGSLLPRLIEMGDWAPLQLMIATDKVETWEDREAIRRCRLDTWLYDGVRVVRNDVMMTLLWKENDEPAEQRRIQLALHHEGGDKKAYYFHVGVTSMPPDNHPHTVGMMRQPQAWWLLLGHDLGEAKQRHHEFIYMWKEALDMQKKGAVEEMTPQQKLICQCTNEDVAAQVYRGHDLFLQKRYAEAVEHLRWAFLKLSDRKRTQHSKKIRLFYEVAYLLGFSMMELGSYERAYYYLDLLSPLQRVNFTQAYIGCMVALDDFRVEMMVNDVMGHLEANMSKSGDDDESEANTANPHLVRLYRFLQRMRVIIMVRDNRYDEAKHELRKMLSEPEQYDFAISQLAEIQKKEDYNNEQQL